MKFCCSFLSYSGMLCAKLEDTLDCGNDGVPLGLMDRISLEFYDALDGALNRLVDG